MLYLILSSEVEIIDLEKGEFKYSPLLKIGYTKDIDSRFDSYELHNPGCKLLGKRKGGTDLESYFHSYYSKYKYPKREEWFYYSQEIVDNFQTLEIGDKFLSKEEYIEGFKEYLKSNIPTPNELKNKYLEGLLKELESIESEVEFNREFHKSLTLNMWNERYNKELDFIGSFDFYNLLKDFPEEINLRENPWKNSATFYYRVTVDYKKMSGDELQETISKKREKTNRLLRAFDTVLDVDKKDLAETYEDLARLKNYKNDYIAVNKYINQKGEIILRPVLNNLVMVNEIRAFKIQQIDYADRFAVFSTIHNQLTKDDIINQQALEFLEEYNSLTEARKKLILLCESSLNGRLSKEAAEVVISQIPDSDYIKGYYQSLGPEKLKRLGYIRANIERELGIVTFSGDILLESIYSEFKEGEKYSLSSLKNKLSLIYSSINYDSTPKANDIEKYFEIRGVVSYEKDERTGKRKQIRGYELVKSKERELNYELKLAE